MTKEEIQYEINDLPVEDVIELSTYIIGKLASFINYETDKEDNSSSMEKEFSAMQGGTDGG